VPRPTGYIAKKEMLRYPLLRNWMRYLHCLFLDRNDLKQGLKTILEGIDKVKSGISICIFPEGTRNKVKDTFLPFRDGSFKIAEKTGCAIVPMTLNNTGEIFEDHLPYIRKTHVVLEYGKPIYMSEMTREEKKNIGKTVQGIIKETYFKNQELV
jgi:1-acyl-sn-glycerol-3-phosphate acyltransferase